MKKLLYLLVVLFFLSTSNTLFSQTRVIDEAVYEKISKTFVLNDDGSQEFHFYKKMKFNSYESFFRYYGETFILYNSEYQTLKINKSSTTRSDEKVVETPPNAFNEALPSFAAKAPAYNYLKEMIVTHTALELGAVVELDYTITTKPGFLPAFENKVVFAEEIPVNDYLVTVKVPKGTKMGHGFNRAITPEPKPEEEDGKEVYVWNAKNLVAIPKEDFIPSDAELISTLVFSTARDFQTLFNDIAGQAAFKSIDLPESAVKFVNEVVKDNRLEIMQVFKIQDYVVDNINTINIPDEMLGYTFAEPRQVWQRNYGTHAEKAILMAAMLNQAGIKAFPAIVAPKSYYEISVASPAIFNGWVVKIILADNTPFYLSPVKHTDVNMKYKYLSKSVAWPIDPENREMRSDIFSSVSSDNKLSGFMTLDKDLNLTGNFEIRLEADMNPYLAIEKDINHIKKLTSIIPEKSFTIDTKKTKVSESRTEAVLNFTQEGALKQKGDYLFLEIPELKAVAEATELGPLPTKRDAPFVLPAFKSTTSIRLVLPEGYTLVTSAIEKESRKSFGFYKINCKLDGNTVIINRQIEISESFINIMHYDIFRTFIAEWNDDAYKQLILKNK
ncbi:MAG: DUF3857 domain-containing protein [Bacteroidales bacterium]|jgi:hypothetical protein|nr:DUF3857 domain-containing protein [Bacteroidales bacterium]